MITPRPSCLLCAITGPVLCEDVPMKEAAQNISLVADLITILAGIIAVGGIIWALLARSRLAIHSTLEDQLIPQLTLRFDSIGGNPVRDITIQLGKYLNNGTVTAGDGWNAVSHLYRGDSLTIFTFAPDSTTFGSEPDANEFRLPLSDDEGVFAHAQWQSSIFPWTRSSALYMWPTELRYTCQLPRPLRYRKKRQALRDLAKNRGFTPSVGRRHTPSQDHALTVINASEAMPLANQQLPTLAVFTHIGNEGGIAQRRVLELFASQNATQMSTVLVDMSVGSRLIDEFNVSVIPTLIILRDDTALRRETGYHSFPQLMELTEQYRV